MQWLVKPDMKTDHEYIAVDATGRSLLLNPFTNKGTAFTPEERRDLDLYGLVPPVVSTMEDQLERTYENFKAKTTSLEKFIYLAALHDRNETLFHRLVYEHIDEMMPIVYTPAVGEACQRFSHIYRASRGLYISYDQRDNIAQILSNYPRPPAIIVATDGERILGLGDQGTGGMGIPIGKLSLYTLCAGIPPYLTLPVMLDVGTDNEERLADPLYLGLRQHRIRGEEYQGFIDKFVAAVKEVYPNALLQWEDFLKANAITQLSRFRDVLPSFNDDIQGTASVVLAGIYSALKLTGSSLKDQRILFAGAGASAQGIAHLLSLALLQEGLSESEAHRLIWMVDSKGLVTQGRQGLEDFKQTYAREVAELDDYTCRHRSRITLEEAVENVQPTILIGSSGTPNTFTEGIVRNMAKFNDRPVILPLSNPTNKSECTPEEAIKWTDGRAVVATGSPFDPVDYRGIHYRIGQCNNAFIFPGVGLGMWVAGATRVSDEMFLDAAAALASTVTEADLKTMSIFPELSSIRAGSRKVAEAVARRAVASGYADEAVLSGLDQALDNSMWFPDYRPILYERRVGNWPNAHKLVRR